MDHLPPPGPRKRGRPAKVPFTPLDPPPVAPPRPADCPLRPHPDDPDVPDYVTLIPDEEPRDPLEDDTLTDLERDQFRDLLAEFTRRQMEALRLFEPMAEQERFFSSHADERVALGGNRGGKTTAACVDIARAVTGQDPHGKYPDADGRCILVGKDLTHCAKVFYRKLFKPGSFQIIRDLGTNLWRAYRPDSPEDLDRQDEARPAPPLISPRYYDYRRISWDNKKEELPKTIPLKNGWEIYFFSSLGVPPQGWDVDLVAFDEEIEHPLWYPEMSARLLDRRKLNRKTGRTRSGKFLWSATPQAGTVQLYELAHRAAEEREEGVAVPTVEVFRFGMLDNEFMSSHAKDAFVRKFQGNEEEFRVRVMGEFALLGTRVYGEFLPRGPHGCDSFPVPHEWTRYAALDPGRQVCAILFAAVPPPQHPDHGRVFLYDELYIRRASAKIVAAKVREKLGDQRIHKWYIDSRAGRQTEIGSGLTLEHQYTSAFFAEKIFGHGRPTGFIWTTASGADDLKAGIEAVRTGLHLDADGRSKWVVFRDKCKNFCWEAEIYSFKKLPSGLVTDDPIQLNNHLMDDWRYLAMANLKYAKPKVLPTVRGYTNELLKQKKERARAKGGGGDSIVLG